MVTSDEPKGRNAHLYFERKDRPVKSHRSGGRVVNVHYIIGSANGTHEPGRESYRKCTERVTTSKAVEVEENPKAEHQTPI